MTHKKQCGKLPATNGHAADTASPDQASTPKMIAENFDDTEVMLFVDPRRIARSPFQHRTIFDEDEMHELRSDIKRNGVIAPLIVRRNPPESPDFELVNGERRLRCALDLAQPLVPVFIRKLTNRQVQEQQWSDNYRRVNPNPLDEAKGLKYLLAYHNTVDGLARYISKPRAYVLTRLQLLDLIPPLQEMVHAGIFKLKDALEIACLDKKSQQAFFDDQCSKWKDKKGFCIYNLENVLHPYRCDLSRAIFNPKDAELVPEAGACTHCPYNSASYQSLFPELADRAHCSRLECYLKKCQAMLKTRIHELMTQYAIEAIVISGKLDSTWETTLAEIPESASWPRYSWNDVRKAWPPQAPDRGDYVDEADPDDDGEAEFVNALEEYDQARKAFDELIQQGLIIPAFHISGYELDIQYLDLHPKRPGDEDDSPTRLAPSAAAVKTALKAGTATPELLQGEIARLRDREKRSQELDAEKIQREIHTQFASRVTDTASPAALTPGDRLGIRLLVYQSLSYQARHVLHDKYPWHEPSADQPGLPLLDWLDTLAEGQVAFMTRLAFQHKGEALLPAHPTAKTIIHMAFDIGVDIEAIRAAQGKMAADRQSRMTERIAALERKIAELRDNIPEPVC